MILETEKGELSLPSPPYSYAYKLDSEDSKEIITFLLKRKGENIYEKLNQLPANFKVLPNLRLLGQRDIGVPAEISKGEENASIAFTLTN